MEHPPHDSRMPVVASTGPRARARGNCRANHARSAPPVCFNGAARTRARKYRPGHGRRHRKLLASTGPRARARGNQFEDVDAAPGDLASTGPRARARGNLRSSGSPLAMRRCFNGAARTRARKSQAKAGTGISITTLQRGRAHARAEIDQRSIRPNHSAFCFTGAARPRARK